MDYESNNVEPTLENQEPNIIKYTDDELQSMSNIRYRLKNIKADTDLEFVNDKTHIMQERRGHYHTDIFLDDLYDDADEALYQTVQYIKNYNYYGKIQDLIRSLIQFIKTNVIIVIMFSVWLYSWVVYQATKLMEIGLRKLLLLPDEIFSFVYWTSKIPKTNDNKYIQILSAFNEHGNITNKFKLFLNSYFDSSNEIHDIPGFDMNSFIKLFNCTLLYCSYLLKDPANLDNELNEHKKRILISRQETKGKLQRYKKSEFISEQSVKTSDEQSVKTSDEQSVKTSDEQSVKTSDAKSSEQERKPLIDNVFLNSILYSDIFKHDEPTNIHLKESNILLSHCTFE